MLVAVTCYPHKVSLSQHNLKSGMSSQKPRHFNQKSLLSLVRPQDNKANVDMGWGSRKVLRCRNAREEPWLCCWQLLSLLKQAVPSYLYSFPVTSTHFLPSSTATGIRPSSRGGLITTRGCATVKVWMLCFNDKVYVYASIGNSDSLVKVQLMGS